MLEDSNLCGYLSDQVRLLKQTSATKHGILDALDNLSQVQPTDTVFLFFAGHGSLGTDGNYYLLSHDVQLSGVRVKAGTGISEFELLQKLNAIPAKRLFMVFNACHSGLIAPDTLAAEKDEIPETLNPSGNTANALLGTGEGRILIVASREEQYSYIGKGQTTIFTKALTDGLKGEAGNNGGTISAFALYEYVYHEVKETVADDLGRVQEPMLTVIKGVGPFPVALYRGASTLGDFSDDREILEETAVAEVSQKKAERSFNRIINTGGGAFVGGNVDTGGGSFIGRDNIVHGDEVGGDKVMGDKVGGDKFSVGDISGSGIAIGRSASASVTTGDTYSGDFRGGVMNVRSTLSNVSQSIGAIPYATNQEKERLEDLIQQLESALEEGLGQKGAPLELPDDAEKMIKRIQSMVDEANDDKPDQEVIETWGDRVKRQAQEVGKFLPAILPLATKIVEQVLVMLP